MGGMVLRCKFDSIRIFVVYLDLRARNFGLFREDSLLVSSERIKYASSEYFRLTKFFLHARAETSQRRVVQRV